jgi:signal transduction histidine kinase
MVLATRMSNADFARSCARKAYALASKNGDQKRIIRGLYLMALVTGSSEQDSVFFMLNRALSLSRQYSDQADVSVILYSLALLYLEAGEIKTAVTLLDSALVYAHRRNQISTSGKIYNTLGNVYLEINDSATALRMYQTAYKTGAMQNDYTIMGVAAGNLAQFNRNNADLIRDLGQAILMLKKTTGSAEEIAQFSVNAGLAETDPIKALNWYVGAFETGKRGNVSIPQLGALNNMVYSLLEIGLSDSAESCMVNYAIPIATRDENHDWLSTLHDTYADILIHQGKFKKAAENLKISIAEKLAFDNQRSASQVRLLAAIMDAKNREEALLKSNAELEISRITVKEQYLAGLAIVLVASVAVMLLLLRNQRRKIRYKNLEMELNNKIIEFEEHQTATLGRELHDVVSSLMQRLSGHIRTLGNRLPALENDTSIRLEELLASIRTISHRMNKLDFSNSNLRDILIELTIDMVNLTGIDLEMEVPDRLPPMSEAMSRNVYRIVQELLTNAAKYAGGAPVRVSLGTVRNKLVIAYQDQGPGIDPLIGTSDGIGLTGIRERAEIFGGTARTESSPGNGLSWIISLPLNPGIN